MGNIGELPNIELWGNSPIVNRFPVIGLHPSRCKNAQGIFLVPNSVHNDKNTACNSQTLNVNKDGTLFAGPNCTNDALDGASFQVQHDTTKATIEISAKWQVGKADRSKDSFGYILRKKGDSRSLCDPDASRDFQRELSLYNDFNAWKYIKDYLALPHSPIAITALDAVTSLNQEKFVTTDSLDNDLVIAFPGEVRGEDSETIPNSTQPAGLTSPASGMRLPRSICTSSRRTTHPIRRQTMTKRRTAALKMVTANYCNVSRYTYEGNEISWEYRTSKKWEHKKWVKPAGDIEAIWNETGALCLDHTRLFSATQGRILPRAILPATCLSGKPCLDGPSTKKEYTVRVFHGGRQMLTYQGRILPLPFTTMMTDQALQAGAVRGSSRRHQWCWPASSAIGRPARAAPGAPGTAACDRGGLDIEHRGQRVAVEVLQ